MSNFNNDNQFSKHKDVLLKDYWGKLSYEGRYVLTGSEFLQRTHGIDVIIQTKNDESDIKIDTKHIRGDYSKLFIEELSCSVPGIEKDGWLIKENGHPDYIIHVMNPLCSRCYDKCDICNKPIRENMKGWISHFSKLRDWYLPQYKNDELETKYPLKTMKQINKTTGRNIPIKTLKNISGTKLCDMGIT